MGLKRKAHRCARPLAALTPHCPCWCHMPRAPGVKICRGGRDNGTPHAFPTSPLISQSCAPLTFAARRAHRCFAFLLSGVLAQRGEVVFKRAKACCSTAAIEPDPPLSRKRLSSTLQALMLQAGLTAQTPSKRPAVQAK